MKKTVLAFILFSILQPPATACFATDYEMSPDNNGNLKEVATQSKDIRASRGDVIKFTGLKPDDHIIEIDAKENVTEDLLCNSLELSSDVAHEVPAQDPLPSKLYPDQELSGPYHTYPAGIYVMSPASDECGSIESDTGSCPAGTEVDEKSIFEYNGKSYRLCQTTGEACTKGELLDSLWKSSAIQGVFLRVDWKDINPALDEYRWRVIDRAFAKAVSYSKNIMLGIRLGGNSIPDWIFDNTESGGKPAVPVMLRDWGSGGTDLPNSQCGFNYVSASPSDANFKYHYLKVLEKLAEHIRADQRKFSLLSGVKVTGLGQQTLENRAPKRCNIAMTIRDAVNPEGYLIAPEFTDQFQIGIDTKYQDIKFSDKSDCICNPSAFSEAGYRPSKLYSFYTELGFNLQKYFGYKQKTYMNISAGFPQIAENGRFMGDHLDHYVFDPAAPFDSNALSSHPKITITGRQHKVNEDNLPGGTEQTEKIIENGRSASSFGDISTAPFGWGVENAALDLLPLEASNEKCSQQTNIEDDPNSPFYGSAMFPIPKKRVADSKTDNCPNSLAVNEGIQHGKVTGFQVRNIMEGPSDIDSALWNMTLNSNALFFEAYERNIWRTLIETNDGKKPLTRNPYIKSNAPSQKSLKTKNANLAKGKTLKEWNTLLLERAKVFSRKKKNPFIENPHPDSYSIKVTGGSAVKYIFNSRACIAYSKNNNKKVLINKITLN